MRRFLTILLLLVIFISFVGCSAEKADSGKIKIVTTVFPFYDFARQVAGNKAEVTLLLPVGAEAHSYEPSMQDVIKIKECDLFIHLGMGGDPWTDNIINDRDFDKNNVFSAMEYVNLEKEHHDHGHSEYEYDQHIWTSLRNSEEIVQKIAEYLSGKDKENADFYKKNADEYCKKLNDLDKKFEEITAGNTKTVAFADGFPFMYFAEDYNLKYISALPGCSGESEPSVADVAEFIDKVNEEDIKVIFYTETSNGQLPDTICEKTGAEKMLFHSCHTVTKKQFNSGVTYFDLMEQNYQALYKAIK